MTRILRSLMVLFAVVMLAASAQASIVPVTLQFSDPAWSGAVSFDDTTGVPWQALPPATLPFTAYLITDMTISHGAITWTEDEIDPAFVPPFGGLILDSVGRAAIFFSATDSVTGAKLETQIQAELDTVKFTSTLVQRFVAEELTQFAYTAFVAVPVPGTLWLVPSSLLAVGAIAWRRR